jgi:hypothetical protein
MAVKLWQSADGVMKRASDVPHHQTAKLLHIAAAYGCGICSQFLGRLVSHTRQIKGYTERPEGSYLMFNIDHDGYVFTVRCRHPGGSVNQFWKSGPITLSNHPSLLCETTEDPRALRLASVWLSSCAGHSCAAGLDPDYYPPRLLRIKKGSVILLDTTTSKPSGKYATLSYCWGRNPKHLTLKANRLDRFRQGIKVSELARTFRDGIAVAQTLGISLLWIDSLCILQSGPGAEADWQNHLNEMSTIYSNCWLNISADHGDSAEDGCFAARDPDCIKPCMIELPEGAALSLSGASPSDERVLTLYPDDFWVEMISNTPLFRRGWVHQERLLSPRILHFGAKQLSWECSQCRACETFPAGIPKDMGVKSVPFSTDEMRDPDIPQTLEYQQWLLWAHIVQAYSSASVTQPQDKLAAIAGIAKRLCGVSKTGYIAGLLEYSLPWSLCWFGTSANRIMSPFRAPSWSWASCDGTVSFISERGALEGELCSIDQISLEYVDSSNPYGQLKAGHLILSACVLQTHSARLTPTETNTSFVEFPAAALNEVSFYFDESSVVQDRADMVLPILVYSQWHIYGLILVPAGGAPPSWMRIGMFLWNAFSSANGSFEVISKVRDCPRSTFKII